MDSLERKIPTNGTHILYVSLRSIRHGYFWPLRERERERELTVTSPAIIDLRPSAMTSACSEIFITSARAGKRDDRTGEGSIRGTSLRARLDDLTTSTTSHPRDRTSRPPTRGYATVFIRLARTSASAVPFDFIVRIRRCETTMTTTRRRFVREETELSRRPRARQFF